MSSSSAELARFFKKASARPKKADSQNFLVDSNIVRKALDLAQIDEEDRVLEIGAGLGAITQELLRRKARVVAIEKDPLFQTALKSLPESCRLTLHHCDFLEFPLSSLASSAPLKVISNLPFHLTAPILERLCENHALFSTAHLWMQKELADRILSKPGSKKMSTLTYLIQLYAKATLAMPTSRNCFYPAPNVDTTLIRLDFHPPILQNPKPFMKMIHTAYQQRRKMLRSSIQLSGPFSHLRPEALSLEDWLSIWKTVSIPTA